MEVPTSQFSPLRPGTWPIKMCPPNPTRERAFGTCAGSRRFTIDVGLKELAPSRSIESLYGVVKRVSLCELTNPIFGACMFALALVNTN